MTAIQKTCLLAAALIAGLIVAVQIFCGGEYWSATPTQKSFWVVALALALLSCLAVFLVLERQRRQQLDRLMADLGRAASIEELTGFETRVQGELRPLALTLQQLSQRTVKQSAANLEQAKWNIERRFVEQHQRTAEALARRDAILDALVHAGEQLLGTADLLGCIPDVLTRLGLAAKVSRVYIYETNTRDAEATLFKKRYEWEAPGISAPPEMFGLHFFPRLAEASGTWRQSLAGGKLVHANFGDFQAEEQRFFEDRQVKSILLIPIFVLSEWWGFFGFEDCQGQREWSAAEVDALQAASLLGGSAIHRLRLQRELLDQKNRYRVLFDAASDAIFIESLEGAILDCNRAACELFGYLKADLMQKKASDLVPPELIEEVPEVFSAETTTGGFFRESMARRGDGTVFPILLNTRILSVQGEPRLIVFIRDNTGFKRSEQEQLEKADRLQEAARLEAAQSQAGELAAGFNDLLTHIIGHAELMLLDLAPDSPLATTIQEIRSTALRASRTNQLLLAQLGRKKS